MPKTVSLIVDPGVVVETSVRDVGNNTANVTVDFGVVVELVTRPEQVKTMLQKQLVNPAKVVAFDSWHGASRYERFQRLQRLTGTQASVSFHGTDFVAGGALRALGSGTYRMLMDGAVVATVTVAAGATRGVFILPLTGISNGWHQFDISGDDPTETSPAWYMHVGVPIPGAAVPVACGSWEVAHRASPHYFGMIPGGIVPKAMPLAAREYPHFNTALPKGSLYRENLVPRREGNIHRPNVDANGVVSTFNNQNYFFSDLVRPKPTIPLLDGPRNIGTLMMCTALLPTRQGGVYFADPWRVGRVAPDGTVMTRAGYRHKKPPSHWAGPQDLELVGDWSAIPVERRGFHEIWGLAWDLNSLALNPTAAPIGGEQPHLAGPRLFVADSQRNRVILLTYNKADHAEPVVSEFLVGLKDPWDVVWVDNVLYVSERTAHRIAKYNATTGEFLGVLVSGAALANVDVNRWVRRTATLAVIQAEACVAPEGLAYQDGWLYFGSIAMAQVKRVNIVTGEVQLFCAIAADGNSKFAKIGMSDGTFGPRGTVFVSTWSIASFGMPRAYLPGGVPWGYHSNISGAPDRGAKGIWGTVGYASATTVGNGRLFCASSEEGLVQISQALPTDPAPDYAKYNAGYGQWNSRGHHLIHGFGGFGYHGLPLPWGETPETDYFLRWNGHAP